jgi:CxC1 like cysteine cluster associated with KDZ transposases
MRFQREHSGAHPAEEQNQFVCRCGSQHHSLEVLCVHMECVKDIMLDICKCRPAPVQLVQHGFFPCSPVHPTLAVSLDMLEFITELFLHIVPNERGWAAMLVKYLKTRGYRFMTADSFRCCFANALAHYQQLVRLINAEVGKLVDRSQALVSGEDPPILCMAPQLDETTLVNE